VIGHVQGTDGGAGVVRIDLVLFEESGQSASLNISVDEPTGQQPKPQRSPSLMKASTFDRFDVASPNREAHVIERDYGSIRQQTSAFA
jgi:hypothetical protein